MKVAVASDCPTLEGNIQSLTESLFLLIMDVDTTSYQSLSSPFADWEDDDRETVLVFDLVAEDVQVLIAAEIPPNTNSELERVGLQTFVCMQGKVQQALNQFRQFLNAHTTTIPDDISMD